jgi:multidrug efflux pump subunit AcrB
VGDRHHHHARRRPGPVQAAGLEYPDVAPPAVEISATYPGASAKVVEDSVTQIIEQNMKGLMA